MGGSSVAAGAAGSVLAHVDVVQQAITVQETLPWGGGVQSVSGRMVV